MKKEDLDVLKQSTREALRGNTITFCQPQTAELVLSLIADHEGLIRGEQFWGERAPLLNDELLAIRPLEKFSRLIANGGEMTAEQRKELGEALAHLDAVRAAQAKKGKRSKAA